MAVHLRIKAYVLIAATLCSAACASRDWSHQHVSRNARSAWRKHHSFYALHEHVDCLLARYCKSDISQERFLHWLGHHAIVDYPGIESNTIAFQSYRKTKPSMLGGGHGADILLATFCTREFSLERIEWISSTRYPWGHINLPFFVNASEALSERRDPRTAHIGLDRHGQLFLGYTRITTNLMNIVFDNRYEKSRGYFPIIIGSDSENAFGAVWKIVDAYRKKGIVSIAFATWLDNDKSSWCTIDAIALPDASCTRRLNLTGTKDYPNNTVLIELSQEGAFLHGRNETIPDDFMHEVAAVDQNARIVIIPEENVTHGEIVRLIVLCKNAGLINVAIANPIKSKERRHTSP